MASERPEPGGRSAWRAAWAWPRFRLDLAVTGALVAGATIVHASYVTWNEGRPGVVLPDPVLRLFAPRDVGTWTFALIYGALLGALVGIGSRPRRLVRAFQGYAYLALVRVALMALVPLDPPATIIPLRDPLVELFSTGDAPLTRDLFFSGHTATLFLLYLVHPPGRVRAGLLLAAIAVAGLTVWQHTHYVVDVLVAPFVAYGCVRLAGLGRTPLGTTAQDSA